MPKVIVNSIDIQQFGFDANIDLKNLRIVFDIAAQTVFNGSGVYDCQGICFSVVDQNGVPLLSFDWSNPQITQPSTDANEVYYGQSTYELDLSDVFSYDMMFQRFRIQGAIKNVYGDIYVTEAVVVDVCKPDKFNDKGIVPGMVSVNMNCNTAAITLKDLTAMVYNKKSPSSKTVTGTLYYPRGTVAPFVFTSLPASNSQVWTGNYELRSTVIAKYDMGNSVYVLVTYYTYGSYEFDCNNNMANVLCCVMEVQDRYKKNEGNPIGAHALRQIQEITVPMLAGFLKEQRGESAAEQVKIIRDTLKCDCGRNSVTKVERSPVNAAIYNIVIEGFGGTDVEMVEEGNTRTFNITSSIYSVGKANNLDTGFNIEIDTSIPNNIRYLLSFDYGNIANYIYNATSNSEELKTLLNSLIFSSAGVDLSNVNGRCIIDLSSTNFFLSLRVASASALVTSLRVGSTDYAAPANLLVSNVAGIEAWLNGLSLGDYEVSFTPGVTGFYINILSLNNANALVSMTFNSNGATTVAFQRTNKSLVALLQAVVDYLCEITAAQVQLGEVIELCYVDYNGNAVSQYLQPTDSQRKFNRELSYVICDLVDRIRATTSSTCASVKALFLDRPVSSLTASGRLYGADAEGNCTAYNIRQLAQGVILAINSYADVKAAFCAIDCSTVATCPDILSMNVNVVSGDIGLYGLTWAFTPAGAQTVTVRYKPSTSSTWVLKTNALSVLQNGNVSGSVPYIVLAGATPGVIYDVQVLNNCGGQGAIQQIAVPTSSVFSGQFLLGSNTYGICGASPVTLYSSSPFGTGVTMYTDINLTSPVTGFLYISQSSAGDIYEIGLYDGVVGINTTLTCFSSVMLELIVGNNAGTICDEPANTYYVVSAFEVGAVLYEDAALTTPLTGFAYVVNPFNNAIHALNTSTGVVGAATGSVCGLVTLSVRLTEIIADQYIASPTTVYAAAPFGTGITLYENPSLLTPVTGFLYVSVEGVGDVFNLNMVNGIVGTFTGVTI